MATVLAERSADRRSRLSWSVKTAQVAPNREKFSHMSREDLSDRLMLWLDPAHAGGTGLAIGGGLTLLDGLRGEKTFERRLAQTALGAGLLYGGYRTMTDPRWGAAVNDYGRKAYGRVSDYSQRLLDRIREYRSRAS